MHFIDPACPCTRYSLPHIADLENTWKDGGIRFTTQYAGAEAPGFEVAVPASPAVAIWNSDGELTYFGPYTSGQYCGQGEDIVQQHLEVPEQSEGQWTNQEAVGCFCEWPENSG